MRMSADPTWSGNLADVDLADPVLFSDHEPHTVFAAVRAHEGLYWQDSGTSGFWSVSRYADAVAVLNDTVTFTSERGTIVDMLDREDPAGRGQMAVTDPPAHFHLRHPIGRPLRPRVVATYQERLRSEVDRLLAPAREGDVLDFAAATMALSTAVAGLVMGLPSDDWPALTRLATASIAPDDEDFADPAGREATLMLAHRELFAYFHDQVSERRQRDEEEPSDLVSTLVSIRRPDGTELTTGEVISNCYSLLMGASVTSPHVPSSTLLHHLETDRYPAWAVDEKRLDAGVEEALRWSSPANHFMRYATRDVEVAGSKVREGDAVVVWIGSANRDDSSFRDPFTYDVGRTPNTHLAFGAGPHYCVGHHAARQTLRLLFEVLGEEFSEIEPAGPARHLRSNFVAGIKSLPITATRRAEVRT